MGRFHMPGEPNECREHAKRCWVLAAKTKNPVLKASLVDLAQNWARLATDLEATSALLGRWVPKHPGDSPAKPRKAG
jgi:hypothetical protein